MLGSLLVSFCWNKRILNINWSNAYYTIEGEWAEDRQLCFAHPARQEFQVRMTRQEMKATSHEEVAFWFY